MYGVLGIKLELSRCPHCSIARPNMVMKSGYSTTNYKQENYRYWKTYACETCGGVVLGSGYEDAQRNPNAVCYDLYPSTKMADEVIPEKPRSFLTQAMESIHAPSGAIMLCASSVDAMLKDKGYSNGNLYSRIDKASSDHLITNEMALWAHEVRLDANEERHAEEGKSMPDQKDAERCVDFVLALSEFLYVLPKKVEQGRRNIAKEKPEG